MKYNLKKVATVFASALMLGSTAGLALAANYPAPFVQSGAANVAVVVGSASGADDGAAALDIAEDLSSALAGSSGSAGSTPQGGDSVKLEKSTDKFNLGDDLNSIYASLDEDELSTVLSAGEYMNDDNDDFEYTQKIVLSDEAIQYFQNSDFNDDKPLIGFEIADGEHILNYTLDFTPDAAEGGSNFTALETTDLTLLGRTYYIVDAGIANGEAKLTLLDTANSAIVSEGEATTVTVGDNSYEVSINFIDSDDVILTVNGKTTNKLQEGDVYKVENDLYIAVKNNLYATKDTGVSQVEISLGSGKIVVEHGAEVQVNGEDVSDISDYKVTAYVDSTTGASSELDSIVLKWDADEDVFLAPGSELMMPGFETIKLSMTGFVSPKSEVTTVEASGEDYMVLKTTAADGSSVNLPFLYANSSGTGYDGIGKDADDRLVTNGTANPVITFNKSQDNWFVAAWSNGDDYESYVLEVTDISDSDANKNTTTIKTLGGKSISLDVDESDEIGSITFELVAADPDTEVVQIALSATGGDDVWGDSIITEEGLWIQLPYNNVAADTFGSINLSADDATWQMPFLEENDDGDVGTIEAFNLTIGFNGDNEVEVDSTTLTTYETDDNSDKYAGYASTALASKVVIDKNPDQQTAEITYAGSESYAEVYVSELSTSFDSEGSDPESLGIMTITDTEAAASTKNLIVLGGSCVNSLAASLMGVSAGTCGDASGLVSGQAMIKSYARTGGKVAVLIAGYEKSDTAKAATFAINNDWDASNVDLKLSTATAQTTVLS